eukprot:TRINITY_DN8113_c0_g1_i1.p1 TRINITY_DN8113_c0_g1~~TRINITY_DN8113_c0_g1_i1.p1  ORF type:complete len:644 (-),score=128.86 TRINITY_DN8113_c0_g1_i1:153-2084(-)
MLAYVLLCLFSLVLAKEESNSIETLIYTEYDGNPCVTLLDMHGNYGCRTSRSGNVGVLELIADEKDFHTFVNSPPSQSKVLVMPANLIALNNSKAINILEKTDRVTGIIFLDSTSPITPFSPTLPNPDNDNTTSFEWNPEGNGFMNRRMPFPLWKLGKNESDVLHKIALKNREKGNIYPLYGAEITAFMHPETTDTSATCLKRGTCLPIGGHSTWTSIVPINPEKEIVFAIAAMDSRSFFLKQSIGANSDMSGTVALMAVLDAIMTNPTIKVSDWKKQPILGWFDAEKWGNLGTKKFLYDIENAACDMVDQSPFTHCTNGETKSSGEYKRVNISKISSVLELKQVGSNTQTGFFVHQKDHNFNGKTAQSVFKVASSTGIQVGRASSTTSGIPPSALKGFISSNDKFADIGVVITDHESSYNNKFYDSMFDDYYNVNLDKVCQSAQLLLNSIYAIANDVDSAPSSYKVNCSLVYELMDCVALNDTCAEKMALVHVTTGEDYPVHYTGVYQSSRTLHQKFIEDWVSDRAAFNVTNITCDDSNKCGENEFCSRSVCKQSATYKHPALSTNVRIVPGELWSSWEVIDETKDPVWTESNWIPLGLRTFLIGDPLIDYVFIGFAVVEAIIVIVITVVIKREFPKHFRFL